MGSGRGPHGAAAAGAPPGGGARPYPPRPNKGGGGSVAPCRDSGAGRDACDTARGQERAFVGKKKLVSAAAVERPAVHWRGLESSEAKVFLLEVQEFYDVHDISCCIFCILLYSKLVAVQTILKWELYKFPKGFGLLTLVLRQPEMSVEEGKLFRVTPMLSTATHPEYQILSFMHSRMLKIFNLP